MLAAGSVHQLHRDADAVPRLSHAPLDDVGDAQFTADLAHVHRLVLVSERRVAGDDDQIGKA